MNNQSLENYVVGRVKELENEVSVLKDERQALINRLQYVDVMKIKMREYFRLRKYDSGRVYIDYSYNDKFIDEIIDFIGFTVEGENEEE